jgi:hypothetical protein
MVSNLFTQCYSATGRLCRLHHIQTAVKGVAWDVVNRIYLARGNDQSWAPVYAPRNRRVSKKAWNFSDYYRRINRTLVRGV